MSGGALRAVWRVARLAPLIGLASCAGGLLGEREASFEERSAYSQAANQAESTPALSRMALRKFLAQWPDGSLSDNAVFMLGEIARREGDLDGALLLYQRVIDDYRFGDAADISRFRIAQIDFERGNVAAARSMMDTVRFRKLPEGVLAGAYRLLVDLATDPSERLLALSSLRGVVPPSQIPGVDFAIDEALVEVDAEGLADIVARRDSRPPTARILLVMADRALQAGDPEAAARALERAEQLPLSPAYRALLISVQGRLRARDDDFQDVPRLPSFADFASVGPPPVDDAEGTIGVVLPLTGPFARFGEASLRGALLAAGVFGEASGAPRLRVRVRDSGGDPERAAQAVRELAAEEELVAVVGPMRSVACEAAAAVAEELGLPLLALTAREEVGRERRFVFRLRTKPEEDVQLLVDRARATGAERFAILYRDDSYGLAMRALFWDAVERASGQVVGVVPYDPEATDFADPIRNLVGYELLERSERKLIEQRRELRRRARRLPAEEALAAEEQAARLARADGWPLPPLVDFDALFIPDNYQNLVLIAPQLAFHEAGGARILAPDGAYDRELLRLAHEHLRGALFAAHFFPESSVPWVRGFASGYEAVYGDVPDAFAAASYDAVRLLALQLAEGKGERESLRDGMLSLVPYPGVSGVIGVDELGEMRKRPFLLGVQRRRARQLTD